MKLSHGGSSGLMLSDHGRRGIWIEIRYLGYVSSTILDIPGARSSLRSF